MLYRLGNDVLPRLIFPLGAFESKDEVRDFVGESGLKNAKKKDSQEICFIPDDVHYMDYLKSRGYKSIDGKFLDTNGKVIGTHRGVPNYTIGQRKHLGMTFGKPMFVVGLNNESNEVILGSNDDLMKKQVISKSNHFIITDGNTIPESYIGKNLKAKVRYASQPSDVMISKADDDIICAVFTEPQRAITPGQSIVFYDGDKVLGGGFIDG